MGGKSFTSLERTGSKTNTVQGKGFTLPSLPAGRQERRTDAIYDLVPAINSGIFLRAKGFPSFRQASILNRLFNAI